MSTLLLALFPVRLAAQEYLVAPLGRWDWLEYNNAVVTWRLNSTSFDWDQPVGDRGPDRAWRDIYGINAVLLPRVGDSALPYGWVMLWGYGKGRNDYLKPAPEAEPYYFAYLSGYFVQRQALTPVLLWNPAEGATQAGQYGYVRYLFDTHPWADPGDYPIYNLFCGGQALLPDGRLLIVGGHGNLLPGANWVIGLRLYTVFQASQFQRSETNPPRDRLWQVIEPQDRSVDRAPEPRWYPSVAALPDGKVLVVGGIRHSPEVLPEDLRYNAYTQYHELFDPCTNEVVRSSWPVPGVRERAVTDLRTLYPYVLLVSYLNVSQVEGAVMSVGPRQITYRLRNPSDPGSEWLPVTPPRDVYRGGGTAVVLPSALLNPQSLQDQVLDRVLTIGGTGDTTALSFDLHQFDPTTLTIHRYAVPDWVDNTPRSDIHAVLLPTGQVLIVGGKNPATGSLLYTSLLYTPPLTGIDSSGTFAQVASAPQEDRDGDRLADGRRGHHSTVLLLPDGRVLAASYTNGGDNHVPLVYLPPYLFRLVWDEQTQRWVWRQRTDQERPRISAINPDPSALNYWQVFKVVYGLSSEGAAIQSVVLVRPGSATHSVNFEQRLVRLHFQVGSANVLHVTAPWHPAIAPPGWYMLFLVDENGVPSKAAWVRLKHQCPWVPPSTVAVHLEGVDQLSAEQAATMENEPLTLEFRNPATGTPLQTFTLPMARPDSLGQVALEVWTDLPAGWYEVYVRPYRSWLGQRVRVNWQPGGTLLIPLRNGDVVKDNQVDYADLVLMLEMQGATGLSEADVNADGVVDEQDAAIVAQNVGEVGDE